MSLEYDNEPVAQKAAPVFEVFIMVKLSFSPQYCDTFNHSLFQLS